MNTRTMYETIMDLPLFKGISADHVSSFLEKTKIEFKKYSPGEIICKKGEKVRMLKFILGGKISLTFATVSEEVSITSTEQGPTVIGATRLYGLNPHYDMTIVACSEVSVMEFKKEKYLSLLGSDSIYIMNFGNFLSLHFQRLQEILSGFRRIGLERVLAEWLVLYTTRFSTEIKIDGVEALKSYYGADPIDETVSLLANKGFVEQRGDEILISDRDAIIELVSDLANRE